MEIHPHRNTKIVEIVKHHIRPHYNNDQALSRWTGENPPEIGVTSLRPPLARMLDTILAEAIKDLEARGATEFQLRFDIPDGTRSFVFEILDNGKQGQEVPVIQQAAREAEATVTWSTSDGWNVVSLSSGFWPNS